jgi:hypothetical protein
VVLVVSGQLVAQAAQVELVEVVDQEMVELVLLGALAVPVELEVMLLVEVLLVKIQEPFLMRML